MKRLVRQPSSQTPPGSLKRPPSFTPTVSASVRKPGMSTEAGNARATTTEKTDGQHGSNHPQSINRHRWIKVERARQREHPASNLMTMINQKSIHLTNAATRNTMHAFLLWPNVKLNRRCVNVINQIWGISKPPAANSRTVNGRMKRLVRRRF